jgi:prephenate dehydratase
MTYINRTPRTKFKIMKLLIMKTRKENQVSQFTRFLLIKKEIMNNMEDKNAINFFFDKR